MYREFINKVWPDWQVNPTPLGKGSYGVVYEAHRNDYGVESHAAIKVVAVPQNEAEVESLLAEGMTEQDTDEYLKQVVDDFIKEVQLMESFKGVQNIVNIEDFKIVKREDRIGWIILIRMELLTPLTKYLRTASITERRYSVRYRYLYRT